jgi:pyruvate dehydrogenase E2 component (dihydrolipoamide acetyltransferase)
VAADLPQAVRATPLARGLAQDLQIDLSRISGSGPRGRIYRADVERYQAGRQVGERKETVLANRPATKASALASAPGLVLPDTREKKRIPLKGAREIIARRMAFSASTIPHVHLTIQVDMSEAEAARLREMVNPVYERSSASRISYTAFLARAAAHALAHHPVLNSSLVEGEIIVWEDIHLGIAVQFEDTLVVPVVREAQRLRLEEIAARIKSCCLPK